MDNLLPHQNLSLEDMDGEIWKDIEGYDGYYQISNLGRVKSLSRIVSRVCGDYLSKDKILKTSCSNGYFQVVISYNNKRIVNRIHRLIAINFIDNPNKKPSVNHINSNRGDNSLNNLEWVSSLENNCHKKYNRILTSKYKGVHYRSTRFSKNNWISKITINKKYIYLGCFNTEEEAYQVRCEYEKNNNIKNKYL
jgi:hypothetical protein